MSSKSFAIAAVANAFMDAGLQVNENSICPPIPESAVSMVCKIVSFFSKNAPTEMVKDGLKAYHKICCPNHKSHTTTSAPVTTGSDVTTADPFTTGADVTTADPLTTGADVTTADPLTTGADVTTTAEPDTTGSNDTTTAEPITTGSIDTTTADSFTTGSDISNSIIRKSGNGGDIVKVACAVPDKDIPEVFHSIWSLFKERFCQGAKRELEQQDLEKKGNGKKDDNNSSIFSGMCQDVPAPVLSITCHVPDAVVPKNPAVLVTLFDAFKSTCCKAKVVIV